MAIEEQVFHIGRESFLFRMAAIVWAKQTFLSRLNQLLLSASARRARWARPAHHTRELYSKNCLLCARLSWIEHRPRGAERNGANRSGGCQRGEDQGSPPQPGRIDQFNQFDQFDQFDGHAGFHVVELAGASHLLPARPQNETGQPFPDDIRQSAIQQGCWSIPSMAKCAFNDTSPSVSQLNSCKNAHWYLKPRSWRGLIESSRKTNPFQWMPP